ncbi:UDP-2,3-diacylglucosamine diphosphatase [Ramlibacter rhizophilus]|uniref:UDP-2,3-diacylglucosamine hydrolase n=1 Tax=Ramlibacter rhizophilus TaxID=1781167 RepID=A0A4Z0C1I4_9BURK|nr:UDP-2,3-diacylglucosamine diphosphatase [Ramlibacter rhizophilus]TFZ04664.1 UDP-2,3-diacylglucosamine diphosphatase [Ramlibacter rhizophilus]
MDAAAPAPIAELEASGDWGAVDFISDLHLQAQVPTTFEALDEYLAHTPAQAVFVLGDLFEAWVGDDAAAEPGYEADCAALLASAARRRPLFFMAGNRDFLVGQDLARLCGIGLLHDPTVLVFGGHRWLLSHGDALCTGDAAYQQYRAQVRDPAWMAQFLRKPLAQRHAMARQMRDASRDHQRGLPAYADVDAASARDALRAARADTLIHGHTHRPGEHALGEGLRRIVLSDWDLQASPPRAQVLRLSRGGGLDRIDLR